MTQAEAVLFHDRDELPDLAPMICRERLVIEGTPKDPITATAITEYLDGLSVLCDMKVLLDPVTHRSDRYGWGGWIHWGGAGGHGSAWEEPLPLFLVGLSTPHTLPPPAAVDAPRSSSGAACVGAGVSGAGGGPPIPRRPSGRWCGRSSP